MHAFLEHTLELSSAASRSAVIRSEGRFGLLKATQDLFLQLLDGDCGRHVLCSVDCSSSPEMNSRVLKV